MRARRAGARAFMLVAAMGVVAGSLAGCSAKTGRSNAAAVESAAPVELDVSAASSLKKVLTDTAGEFEKANGVRLVFNFGATGQLMKQVEGGAPVDVFIAASPSAVATLAAEGLVSADEDVTVAGNTLVILVPKGNPASITGPGDLRGAERVVTGDPAVAPHGQKAQEWLTGLGLWKALASRFVYAANASQTDDLIARGEVDAGIGFASDATGRDDIEIAYTVPDGEIKSIRYVAVPVGDSSRAVLAQAYLDYLLTASAQQAFFDHGFRAASEK